MNLLTVGYAVSFCFGRVYTITLLYNLNSRPVQNDPRHPYVVGDSDSFNMNTMRRPNIPSMYMSTDLPHVKSPGPEVC